MVQTDVESLLKTFFILFNTPAFISAHASFPKMMLYCVKSCLLHWMRSLLESEFTAKEKNPLLECYSRTSMARTLMAAIHGCFELVLESLGKSLIAADLG